MERKPPLTNQNSQDDKLKNFQQSLQNERQQFQEKIFKSWINSKLVQAKGSPQITNLFEDLKDGKYLLSLLEILTGKKLKPMKGNLRLHHLNNLNLAMDVLKDNKIKLVGISNNSITDGDKISTLGLCWSIIYRFQVIEALAGVKTGENAESVLLEWCQKIATNYTTNIKNFQPKKWKNGYTLNAILHSLNPKLFSYSDLSKLNDAGRIENALSLAHNNYNVTPLFQAQDFENDAVDSRTLVMYVSIMYEKMKDLVPKHLRKYDDLFEPIFLEIKGLVKRVEDKFSDPNLQIDENADLKELCKKYNNFQKFDDELEDITKKVEDIYNTIQSTQHSDDITSELKARIENEFGSLKHLADLLIDNSNSSKTRLLSALTDSIDAEFSKVNALITKYDKENNEIDRFLSTVPIGGSTETSQEQLQQYISVTKDFISDMNNLKPLVKFNYNLANQLFVPQNTLYKNKEEMKQKAEQLKDDYETFSDHLTQQLERLSLLSSALDDRKNDEVLEWMASAKVMKEFLQQSEAAHQEILKGKFDVDDALEKQNKLIAKLNDAEPQKESLLEDGHILSSSIKIAERENVEKEINDIQKGWVKLMKITHEEQKRLALLLAQLQAFQEDQIKKWFLSAETMEQSFLDYQTSLCTSNRPSEIQEALHQQEKLIEKIQTADPEVTSLVTEGVNLSTRLNEEENHCVVKEVDVIETQWNNLKQNVQSEFERLNLRLDESRINQIDHLAKWMVFSEEMKNTLSECDVEVPNGNSLREIEEIIENQKSLLEKLEAVKPDVTILLANGGELCHRLDVDDEEKVKTEMSHIENQWKNLYANLQLNLESLGSNLHFHQVQQSKMLSDWYTAAEELKRLIASYSVLQTDYHSIKELEEALMKHDTLQKKISLVEGEIDELRDKVTFLSPDLKDDEAIKMNETMNEIEKLYADLNMKAFAEQERLAGQLSDALSNQNELLGKWFVATEEMERSFSEYDIDENEENMSEKVNESLFQQEAFLTKLETVVEPDIKCLITGGEELCPNLKDKQLEKVQKEMDELQKQWNEVKENARLKLERRREQAMLFNEHELKLDNMLENIHRFTDWLNLAQQQLDATNDVSSDMLLGDLVEREYGLNKLSCDLDSRCGELTVFIEFCVNLKNDNITTPKKDVIIEKVQQLDDNWSKVVENLDRGFKRLYDAINSLLDAQQTELEQSLALVNENLKGIKLSSNVDKQQLLIYCKQVVGLKCEVSKLKPSVNRLCNQVSSLSDVTVLVHDEKESLKQSSDGLAVEFEITQKNVQDTELSLRNYILASFENETSINIAEIKQLHDKRPTYDVKQENADDLRKYLNSEREISKQVEVIIFQMDQLEKFGENVSSHTLLSADDQVLIAGQINDVLKAIEDIRGELKADFNRVYAVTLHILKQRLKKKDSKLAALDKDVEAVQNLQCQNFNTATQLIKQNKHHWCEMVNISSDISSLTSEINSLSANSSLDQDDANILQDSVSKLLHSSMIKSENISIQAKSINNDVKKFMAVKLDEFWGWLPNMQKRSEEGNEIGPDINTTKKQLQEMQVIKHQCDGMSFASLIHGDNDIIRSVMDKDEISDLECAHEEWSAIDEWVTKRTKNLVDANRLWEDFNRNQFDLSEFLREKDRELKTWNQLDLNDAKSVSDHKQLLGKIKENMELRKHHVNNLTDVSEQLCLLITQEETAELASNRSQVVDVHDLWNGVLKRAIESNSKLKKAQETLTELEGNVHVVREWITDVNEMLHRNLEQNPIQPTDESLPMILVKEKDIMRMRALLKDVNEANEDLLSDDQTRSHYTIDDVDLLHQDFHQVASQLTTLKDLGEKSPIARWIYRKVFI